jgi:iron complex outermembrane receptor protein
LSYKNWELNFFLRGVQGNDVLNFSKMSYATTQWLPGANVLQEALTIGLKESPKYCSYYIEDGSFLRMDNASVAYNFDTKGKYGINKLRVYLTGQNLFVITKYTGLDPEVEMSGLDPGVEGREYYPKSRTFSVGINLSF